MKNVLIVSYIFPPVNMIASKRYGTMCKYFEENGYMPYILTTKHDEVMETGMRLDCEIPINKRQIMQVGSVRRNQEAQHSGWGSVSGLLNHWKYFSRTIETAGMGWCEQVKAEIELEKLKDIDIIIGTFPPMANLSVALYLSKKLKIPFIADIRDLISDYSEAPAGYKRAFLIDKIMERNALKKAAAIVPVTSGFKAILKRRYPSKKFKVIYNGWDRKKLQQQDAGKVEIEKYLYYAGTLYPHRLESLKLLIKCLKNINGRSCEKVKFIIRSNGPLDLNARAKNIIRQEGMQECVQVLEAVDENIVRNEQEKAYINVVLSSIDSEDQALMTTIPGKIYELLKEKPPILAIVPGCSDVAKVLHYTNKGIASINEAEITEFIVKKKESYIGNQKINFFSRRMQAKRLCKFMDQLLAK